MDFETFDISDVKSYRVTHIKRLGVVVWDREKKFEDLSLWRKHTHRHKQVYYEFLSDFMFYFIQKSIRLFLKMNQNQNYVVVFIYWVTFEHLIWLVLWIYWNYCRKNRRRKKIKKNKQLTQKRLLNFWINPWTELDKAFLTVLRKTTMEEMKPLL